MQWTVAVLLFLLAPLSQASEWNSTPEALVRAFQADYLSWNNSAMALDEKHEAHTALDIAEAEYAKLLQKYCLPGFKGEPISFGTDSSHDPAKESVLSVEQNELKAVVRTRLEHPSGYSPVYEYELTKHKRRWYLLQVYLLDEGERLPGL